MQALRSVVDFYGIDNVDYRKVKGKFVIKKKFCEVALQRVKASPHVEIGVYKKWFERYGAL